MPMVSTDDKPVVMKKSGNFYLFENGKYRIYEKKLLAICKDMKCVKEKWKYHLTLNNAHYQNAKRNKLGVDYQRKLFQYMMRSVGKQAKSNTDIRFWEGLSSELFKSNLISPPKLTDVGWAEEIRKEESKIIATKNEQNTLSNWITTLFGSGSTSLWNTMLSGGKVDGVDFTKLTENWGKGSSTVKWVVIGLIAILATGVIGGIGYAYNKRQKLDTLLGNVFRR